MAEHYHLCQVEGGDQYCASKVVSATSVPNFNYGCPTPGPQHPNAQIVMDHVFFLSQEQWKAARETTQYDHVVVGSGFCGLAFAERILSKDPKARVLMLERGTFFLPEHFQNLPLPYSHTLGGKSETFPWTLDRNPKQRDTQLWQHGMVPFFGGRSTLWSAWCPRPTPAEMEGWPTHTIATLQNYFDSARRLLRVQNADAIDRKKTQVPGLLELTCTKRPVYNKLQEDVQGLLANGKDKLAGFGIYRTQAAPLASAASDAGLDFQKFSTPGPLLDLALKYKDRFHIAANCLVEKIITYRNPAEDSTDGDDGSVEAVALQTSRGVLPLLNANLILAIGSLPPATLINNSSFPATPKQEWGRFSSHVISSIVARVPRSSFPSAADYQSLELAACYVGGIANESFKQQFHIQLSALSDKDPQKNMAIALRYMPDVVATANQQQLQDSQDYVVFVCACLAELDHSKNRFTPNPQDSDITTNSLLHIEKTPIDEQTWTAMDEATFGMLETVLGANGDIEYWHPPNALDLGDGKFVKTERPKYYRVNGMVHESSTLFIGDEPTAPVNLDYRLRGSSNVFITGGALWPRGGSWNPTMTMVALAQNLADNLGSEECSA